MAGIECAEPLNGELLDQWKLLLSGLLKAESIIAPVMKYSLQRFSDASLMTYGIVLYLKIDTDERRYTHVSNTVELSKNTLTVVRNVIINIWFVLLLTEI